MLNGDSDEKKQHAATVLKHTVGVKKTLKKKQ